MGQGAIPQTFREIGVGHHSGSSTWTIILARPSNTEPALTGVVYDDQNNNNRMDLGEGIPGVSVSAGTATVQTNSGGGWSIPIGPGTWDVTASGGGLPSTLHATATMGSQNVWVDFESEPLPDPRPSPPVH